MVLLEELMEGIERTPDRLVALTLTPEQIEEEGKDEVRIIENNLVRAKRHFDLVKSRKLKALEAYDFHVMKGYSPLKDTQYAEERSKVCIPCFLNFPADKPSWVRINWGLSHIGHSEEAQYGSLLKEATNLEGVESEKFLYSLRNSFETKIKSVKNHYKNVANIALYRPKTLDTESEREEPTPEECAFFENKENKWRLIDDMNFVVIQYQLMIDLIRANKKN